MNEEKNISTAFASWFLTATQDQKTAFCKIAITNPPKDRLFEVMKAFCGYAN
jgi:hypothetical protein